MKTPLFAKRHYEAIAAALREAKMHSGGDSERNGIHLAAIALAQLFHHDNPRFNRKRFIKALEAQFYDL